jgi:transposase
MVNKRMYQKIQELKKKGYGKNEIRKKLRLDAATVRKYYHMRPDEYRQYAEARRSRIKVFAGWREEILLVYRENRNRRLNMSAVYDYLEERFGDLPGGEKSLRNYIHHLERTGRLVYESHPRQYKKVPELPYGRQIQLDFGEYKTSDGMTLYIFATVLSASRYKYVAVQGAPFTTVDVIQHLLDCFDHEGGMPAELVIDQDAVLVVDENHGEIVYTRQFKAFLEEMGIAMYVCRKADPESKGKIENVIKYVKYNFFQVRTFGDLAEARESLRRWLVRRANGKICQATKKVPAIAFEEEKEYLRPLKNSIFRKDSHVGRQERAASDKSYIMVGSNEYSVPVEYRRKTVEIYTAGGDLYVFDPRTGREIARHRLSVKAGARVSDKTHFRNNSITVNDLTHEVRGMFGFDEWKTFVERTRRALPRYVRDQCVLARRYFSTGVDEGVFHMAVIYCLENKTYGMAALKDTYEHQKREQENDQENIFRAFGKALGTVKMPDPVVSKRAVKEYESVVTSRVHGGGRA